MGIVAVWGLGIGRGRACYGIDWVRVGLCVFRWRRKLFGRLGILGGLDGAAACLLPSSREGEVASRPGAIGWSAPRPVSFTNDLRHWLQPLSSRSTCMQHNSCINSQNENTD